MAVTAACKLPNSGSAGLGPATLARASGVTLLMETCGVGKTVVFPMISGNCRYEGQMMLFAKPAMLISLWGFCLLVTFKIGMYASLLRISSGDFLPQ